MHCAFVVVAFIPIDIPWPARALVLLVAVMRHSMHVSPTRVCSTPWSTLCAFLVLASVGDTIRYSDRSPNLCSYLYQRSALIFALAHFICKHKIEDYFKKNRGLGEEAL